MTKKINNTDLESYCFCKACRTTRIEQAKEFTATYGEFRTKKEIISGFFNRDTVSIEVLNERAESVILAKKLEEETKKEAERLEKEMAEQLIRDEKIRVETEKREKEEALSNWREEAKQIVIQNKELTENSLQKIDSFSLSIDRTDPVQLQEFGVILQRSFTAINDNVINIFNKSKIKDAQKTTTILFEKIKTTENLNWDEYKLISSDFELLSSEIAPLTEQSKKIISEYEEQYLNIEKMVNNIDLFFSDAKKAIEVVENDRKILLNSNEVSDLKKLGKVNNYDSIIIGLNKRIESLTITKMHAITFVSDINGMKNIERSFVDDLSSLIYDVFPNWNNRMKTFFEMQSLNDSNSELRTSLSKESLSFAPRGIGALPNKR